jgi:hypothetical protein
LPLVHECFLCLIADPALIRLSFGFLAACRMGLEGLVSKHRDRPYRGGRQKHWIKVKNRNHPAMDREL